MAALDRPGSTNHMQSNWQFVRVQSIRSNRCWFGAKKPARDYISISVCVACRQAVPK